MVLEHLGINNIPLTIVILEISLFSVAPSICILLLNKCCNELMRAIALSSKGTSALTWVHCFLLSVLLSPTRVGGGWYSFSERTRGMTHATYHVFPRPTYSAVTTELNGIARLLLCDYWEIIVGILLWVRQKPISPIRRPLIPVIKILLASVH